MEHRRELHPDEEVDLFWLHYAFKELLGREIDTFTNSWNNHGVRTEHNLTPIQLIVGGLHMTETPQYFPTRHYPNMPVRFCS
jgi:hypothetical protein